MNLKNKTVLVTGSSSGIGEAIAIECAKLNAEVLINYRKNEKGASNTLKEVKKYSNGKIFQADLSNEHEVERLFKEIKANYKSLDCLVNNAGEAKSGEIDDFNHWQYEFQNIFFSNVYVTSSFLKFPHKEELRKIVNISSIYGVPDSGNPGLIQYSAAKSALNNFSLNLAKKYGPELLVNVVAPGFTWTPSWEGTSEETLEACKKVTKIKRFIDPVEIATTVTWLLQNDAMTGEIIRIDGGLHLVNVR